MYEWNVNVSYDLLSFSVTNRLFFFDCALCTAPPPPTTTRPRCSRDKYAYMSNFRWYTGVLVDLGHVEVSFAVTSVISYTATRGWNTDNPFIFIDDTKCCILKDNDLGTFL